MKVVLLDIIDIIPSFSSSIYSKNELSEMADNILQIGCFLQPLTVEKTNNHYKIKEGNLDYYAYLIILPKLTAPHKKMVSCFIT